MVYTVYLSSTLKDLVAEREAVRQALSDECVVKHSYFASENSVLDSCLEDVAKCDAYIGILGLRYGYIPGERNPNKLSITELEYRQAGLCSRPRLIFVKDEDSILLSMSDAEGKENPLARIQAFRKLATDAGAQRVAVFKTVDDLKLAVIKAFNAFRESHRSEESSDSDLVVSSLEGPRRILPFDGHPVLSPDGAASKMYTGGFHVSFTLAHNGKGKQAITLHSIALEVLSFEPGTRSELEYRVAGEQLIGAGTARPHVFSVKVRGQRVEPAQWIMDGTRGTVAKSKGANFLDTAEPRVLTFAVGEANEELRGSVFAREPGSYALRFVFDYSVAGVDRQKITEVIHVYSDE